MASGKFLDLFEVKNFVSSHFFRISYVLAEKLNFWFL